MPEDTAFDSWCIVEILGRKVVAGRVTEQAIAGQGFIRIDVPAVGDQVGFTQMYGPGSIYAITPTTEEIARAFVARNVGAPIQPWQLALPEPTPQEEVDMGYDPNHDPSDDDGEELDKFYCRECETFVVASYWDTAANRCIGCAAPF